MGFALNDKKMVELVNEYNGSPTEFECILYACILGGLKGINPLLLGSAVLIGGAVGGGIAGAAGGMSNDFAILTFSNATISLYVFNKFGIKIIARVDIQINQVCKMKKKKFLIWNTVKLFLNSKDKIKLTFSDKVVGIENQKENADVFLRLLSK